MELRGDNKLDMFIVRIANDFDILIQQNKANFIRESSSMVLPFMVFFEGTPHCCAPSVPLGDNSEVAGLHIVHKGEYIRHKYIRRVHIEDG